MDVIRESGVLTFVFSVLLFDLRLILQLDGLLFEHGTLHILNHLFLLLSELIVHKLHPVNFLPHGDDLTLSNLRVNFLLHLLLELDLAFPEENLTLSFDNLSEDISLFLLEL